MFIKIVTVVPADALKWRWGFFIKLSPSLQFLSSITPLLTFLLLMICSVCDWSCDVCIAARQASRSKCTTGSNPGASYNDSLQERLSIQYVLFVKTCYCAQCVFRWSGECNVRLLTSLHSSTSKSCHSPEQFLHTDIKQFVSIDWQACSTFNVQRRSATWLARWRRKWNGSVEL